MRTCKHCGKTRVAQISAKCSDMFTMAVEEAEYHGYVPNDIGLGTSENYVTLAFCFDCGMMQGQFPLSETVLEKKAEQAKNNPFKPGDLVQFSSTTPGGVEDIFVGQIVSYNSSKEQARVAVHARWDKFSNKPDFQNRNVGRIETVEEHLLGKTTKLW